MYLVCHTSILFNFNMLIYLKIMSISYYSTAAAATADVAPASAAAAATDTAIASHLTTIWVIGLQT